VKTLSFHFLLAIGICAGLSSSGQFPQVFAPAVMAGEGQEPVVKEEKVGGRQDREEEREAEVNLKRRISIVFKATKFSDCLEKLSEATGLNIIASQKLLAGYGKTPVSLKLKNLSVWSVLHVFARSCDLELIENHGVFMFRRQLKRDGLWATMRLHIGVGEIQIHLLRGDVPAEMKRNLIHRVLERGLRRAGPGDRPWHDQDDEGHEHGDQGDPVDEGRPGEVQPAPRRVMPAVKKPDAF
jgi:hypothetical protein